MKSTDTGHNRPFLLRTFILYDLFGSLVLVVLLPYLSMTPMRFQDRV